MYREPYQILANFHDDSIVYQQSNKCFRLCNVVCAYMLIISLIIIEGAKPTLRSTYMLIFMYNTDKKFEIIKFKYNLIRHIFIYHCWFGK